MEKEDSHAGKIVDKKWFERHKHIFPASRWEVVREHFAFPKKRGCVVCSMLLSWGTALLDVDVSIAVGVALQFNPSKTYDTYTIKGEDRMWKGVADHVSVAMEIRK